MMLSKNATKILKELNRKESEYQKKKIDSSKTSYDEVKALFPNSSYISITMMLRYLLKEHYIYNHLSGKENDFDIDDLVKEGKVMLVIGEKGVSYLEYKKFVLMAQIIPITVSLISLGISIVNLIITR